MRRTAAVSILLGGILLAAGGADRVAADDYYRDKTINIVVGFGAGGGYDLYARLLSRHLGNHIPGAPRVVVQNMTGAGSVRAANFVYTTAPKDGTHIAGVNQHMPLFSLLGAEAAKFDPRKFVWLGSMASSNGVTYTWHTSKVRSIDDARKISVTMGSTGTTSDAHIYLTMMNRLVGTQFKLINGYPGGKEIELAMQRGEVDGRGGNSWASLASNNPEWVSQKMVNIIAQYGAEREKELPDVPLMQELVSTERDKQIVELISLATVLGYTHWVAPETPAAQVAILRKGYTASLADPALLEEAGKAQMPINPKPGEALQELVNRVVATPPDVVETTGRMLGWTK